MHDLPNCPKCNSEYTYEDGSMYVCPECAHEWNQTTQANEEDTQIIKDVNGNVLQDGDSVTIIKDMKVKGASTPLKQGTKVKSIRLLHDAVDGHNIDCKIDGFGSMMLRSDIVKKL